MKKLFLLLLAALLCCFAAAAETNVLENPYDPYLDEIERVPSLTRLNRARLKLSGGAMSEADVSVWVDFHGAKPGTLTEWYIILRGNADTKYKITCMLGRNYKDNFATYVYLSSTENLIDSVTLPDGAEGATHAYRFAVNMPAAADDYGLYVTREVISTGERYYNFQDKLSVPKAEGVPTLEERVKELANECRAACKTDYECVVWFHDWLTSHNHYDLDYNYYGPDGAVFRGAAVCDGYSHAFRMVMDELGIPNRRVTGGSHAWNAVCCDGSWFMVDATWDDPSGSTKSVSGMEHHLYLGIDDTAAVDSGHTFSDVGFTDLSHHYYMRTTDESGMLLIDSLMEDPVAVLDGKPVVAVQALNNSSTGSIPLNTAISCPDCPLNRAGRARILGRLISERLNQHGFSTTYIYNTLKGDFGRATVTVPDGITAIEDEAFAGLPAGVIRLPEGLKRLGARAFSGCGKLWRVYIPESLTDIDPDAFAGCGADLTGGKAAKAAAERFGLAYIQE